MEMARVNGTEMAKEGDGGSHLFRGAQHETNDHPLFLYTNTFSGEGPETNYWFIDHFNLNKLAL
jgi:hypothetical protein